ncbi:Dph6-related ATP pyrophosphatase [Mangrovimonas aestuarii]|uniref:Dph6-related ATP pyrophosphatase n=1 Tax=Mangrovimonas aestuarii TaxID=3018443 RepID=UPI00237A063C|nr:diphthine--ammonia ligase [Mangrovimonas aestuarii]
MTKTKTYFNWSSGKDSALALYKLLQNEEYSIEKLVTTISEEQNRVTMHGLHRDLLKAQTQSINIPADIISLPKEATIKVYNQIMYDTVSALKQDRFECAAFGDIFLEDLKRYREEHLAKLNMRTVFPLWKRDTKELMREFIELGFKAVVICANAKYFGKDAVGHPLDENFLNDLPESVDPCGENGEFHTFCFDGPIFKHPIPFKIGEKVYREYPAPNDTSEAMGFWFCDLELT